MLVVTIVHSQIARHTLIVYVRSVKPEFQKSCRMSNSGGKNHNFCIIKCVGECPTGTVKTAQVIKKDALTLGVIRPSWVQMWHSAVTNQTLWWSSPRPPGIIYCFWNKFYETALVLLSPRKLGLNHKVNHNTKRLMIHAEVVLIPLQTLSFSSSLCSMLLSVVKRLVVFPVAAKELL